MFKFELGAEVQCTTTGFTGRVKQREFREWTETVLNGETPDKITCRMVKYKVEPKPTPDLNGPFYFHEQSLTCIG